MIEFFTKHYLDHSQGVNRYSSELLLKDQELYDAKNAYASGGNLWSRRGYRTLGSLFRTEIDAGGTGNAALVYGAGVCTITVARLWKITPTAGEQIQVSGYANAGNNGTFTVTSATTTTVVYANASGVTETVNMNTAVIRILENISTLFEYNNSDGASYLLGVGHLGTMKALLAPDQKQFTATQGAAGAVFTAGKQYRFAITNVDLDGRESPTGEIITLTPTINCATIELTDISVAPSNVFTKKIYRTAGDGGLFYYYPASASLILNGTTTYSDSTADATLTTGTLRNPGQVYEFEWGTVLDYHGKIQQFDTTRKTNFVIHKDYAIAMNGVDRIKWRAPRKLGLFSAENAVGNFVYYDITAASYLEHDYPIGMHCGKYKESTKAASSGLMILDNEPGNARVKLRVASTAANDGLFASGAYTTPFGVPYIDASDVTGATIAAGAAGNPDGSYTYRIACSNMTNSEGPDRNPNDTGDLTPDNERSPGDSDKVTVTSDKIELTTIPRAPTTQMSIREAGQTLTIANPAGSRMTITRNANFDFLAFDPGAGKGEEIEISGSGLSAGNRGKFAITGLYAAPTLTVIEVDNPNVVAEGPINCDVAFVEKIDRATFRKLYRTGGSGAQPHRELKRDTAPAGLDAGYSYYTLPDASITSAFSDDIADSDLALNIYTYYDSEVSPPIPVNDAPPLFLHADSKDNMLITGNLDFKGLEFNYTDPGPLCMMVFNYDEIEGAEFARYTPIGFGNKDSTPVKGISTLKDSVIGLSEKRAYKFENILELDFGIAPKREVISGSSGCRDARSIQIAHGDDGTQSLIYMGNDGLYEILESGLAMALGKLPVQKLKSFFDNTLTGERGRSQDNLPSCIQESEHRYLVAMKEDSNSVNDIIVAFDYKNRAFWFWDNYDAVDLCYWEDKIIHGTGQRAYWEQNKGRMTDYSDNGYAIEAYVETRPYHMDQPDQVKKWDKINVYQAKDDENQVLAVSSRSNFGTVRTNIGRGETALPWGYTNRSLSVNGVILSVSFQSGTTWRYTRTGGSAFNFVTANLAVDDRIRIIDSSPFLIENRGDFVVTAVAATYFEVSNEWGFPEASVTLTAANQFVGYYPTSPPDEMDDIDTLFKNLVFTGTRDPFEVRMAPSSSKFVALRFESFLNNKRMALAGWTMKYGYTGARGNERGGND